MDDEIKAYLKAYRSDLQYWCGVDLACVNHYTNGTPEMGSIKELREYTARLTSLLEPKENDDERFRNY